MVCSSRQSEEGKWQGAPLLRSPEIVFLLTPILHLHCTDLRLSELYRIGQHTSKLCMEDGIFRCCMCSSLVMTCVAVCGLSLCFNFSLVFHGTSTHSSVVSILWLMGFPSPIFSGHKQCTINAPSLSTLWVGLFLLGGVSRNRAAEGQGCGSLPLVDMATSPPRRGPTATTREQRGFLALPSHRYLAS